MAPQRTPGRLEVAQRYNDDWRGWPVAPLREQHPIRGSFLDPRPDPELGAIYHTGVDIAVPDDRPEAGAPPGRTHRVYAIEGGEVAQATPRGVRGLVRLGHFIYDHVDARVERGQLIRPGQVIGWTCEDSWHVHLTEFIVSGGQRLLVNPLRRSGKLHPYVDRAPPEVFEARYYTPATPAWRRRPRTTVALLPQAGQRLDRRRLFGRVDVRVRVSDPQSFIGWFSRLPHLAAPHHPFRIAVTLLQEATGKILERRDVFWAQQLLEQPAGQHFAPGTEQNLPANGCMRFHGALACDGTYWFRLFPKPYWDTTRLPNGRYRLRVRVWDLAENACKTDLLVEIRNPGL